MFYNYLFLDKTKPSNKKLMFFQAQIKQDPDDKELENKKRVSDKNVLLERSCYHSRAFQVLNCPREQCPRLSQSEDNRPMKLQLTQTPTGKASASPWILELSPRDSPTLLDPLSLHHSSRHREKGRQRLSVLSLCRLLTETMLYLFKGKGKNII